MTAPDPFTFDPDDETQVQALTAHLDQLHPGDQAGAGATPAWPWCVLCGHSRTVPADEPAALRAGRLSRLWVAESGAAVCRCHGRVALRELPRERRPRATFPCDQHDAWLAASRG